MRRWLGILISGLIVVRMVGPSFAQELGVVDAEKRADIKRLLAITETQQNLVSILAMSLEDSLNLLERSKPELSGSEFWQEFRQEYTREFVERVQTDEALAIYIPVYEKYLTSEDIKELIKFYESALGQKMIRLTPQLMQECAQVGRQWGEKAGREIGEKVMNSLKQKYEQLGQEVPDINMDAF